MTNTRLQLGYKTHSSMDVVVPGAITQQQIDAITNNLKEGQRIVPNAPDAPIVAPTPESMHTDDPVTLDIPIEDLTAMLSTIQWEQLGNAFPDNPDVLDLDDASPGPGPR
ncbi:hypothetical protein AWH63_10750 [Marinobacter sp. C18]|uniref:hypothetical protein n=1 Tax=Marinobacter sp. C18 TaxID=1772288 RepID=UPI000948C39A|nr:hypothetical protein [Marinobacter sp. C18]OLF82009.1 hypothetical protein AWH63_10750 [Marinobacter sp. C18]